VLVLVLVLVPVLVLVLVLVNDRDRRCILSLMMSFLNWRRYDNISLMPHMTFAIPPLGTCKIIAYPQLQFHNYYIVFAIRPLGFVGRQNTSILSQ
jgi:hypothetical protein